jgi:hypothetical protein
MTCLVPFDRREVASLKEAAAIAGKSETTLRAWCNTHGIGRRVADGQWSISRVALQMLLEGDLKALAAYHSGDRHSAAVASYFVRGGLGELLDLWRTPAKSAKFAEPAKSAVMV